MTKPIIAVIAQGAMGAGVGWRLSSSGVDVVTSLEGRSAASAARAATAGMRPVADAQIADARIILSIVPPSDALGLAQRLSPALLGAKRKPLYIDCNAISTALAKHVADVIGATGCAFGDGGIIGGPPRESYNGPSVYISGVTADAVAPLLAGGLMVKVLEGPVGAASALKMSYASITKGLTAIASASILSAAKYGAAQALHAELAGSQKALLATLSRSIPEMYTKAYRFVGEMEEIAAHAGRPSTAQIYTGMAELYQELADDLTGPRHDIDALDAFFKHRG